MPLAIGQNTFSGNVSFVKFKDDGSFAFQLNNGEKLVLTKSSNCPVQNMFLVKKYHGVVNSKKLTRMRNDIRDAFFKNGEKIVMSVSSFSCDDKTGYLLVDNIMLGKKL